MKYLVVLLVVGIGLWMLSARFRAERRARRDADAPRPPPAEKRPPLADMVACAHCGLHLPAADALYAGRAPYCSAAHLDSGPAAPDKP